MTLNVRSGWRYLRLGPLVLSGLCSLTLLPDIGRAQVGTEATTPAERPPAQATDAERKKAAEGAVYAPPAFGRPEEHHRPGEFYVGGFGGGLNQAVNSSGTSYGNPNFVQIGAPRTISGTLSIGF